MYRKVLTRLFQVNQYAATKNFEGFTHAESLCAPAGGGNSVNWILGHIVASRNRILELLGGNPVLDGERLAVYQRGSKGLGGKELPFESLVQAFGEAQSRIESALAALPDGRLDELVTAENPADNPAFLQFHEAYHIGQLGLLRRIAGKSGAIQ